MTTLNGAPQQPVVISKSGPGASAPAQPAAPAAPAADPVAEAKKFREEGQAALAAAEKRARIHAVEARKFADDKKGIGAKLTEYEQLKKWKTDREREDAQFKLNPEPVLKSRIGDNWYEKMTELRLSGGAPTADTVAAQLQQIEEKVESKFAERDRLAKEAQQQAAQQQTQQRLAEFQSEAIEFAKTSVADFPALEDEFGSHDEIGAALVRVIRSEYERTAPRNAEGKIVGHGRTMTLKEAAEGAEKYLVGRTKKMLARDKYREELTGAPKSAHPSTAGGVPQAQLRSTEVERRTLSNGLTATSPGPKRTHRTDEERRAAAFAAVDQVKGVR